MIHPRRVSISSSNYLFRNKIRHDIDNSFINKTEIYSLTSILLSEDSQFNRLMTFLYDRKLPVENVAQFFDEEEVKKPFSQNLHELYDGDN